MKKIKQPNLLNNSRLEIHVNGEPRLGMSIEKRPADHKEMIQLLKSIIKALKSPKLNHDSDIL